jgi:putative endonuclease
MAYLVYILECSDGSYYTGSTDDVQKRLWQHQEGMEVSSYTYTRRPVKLV